MKAHLTKITYLLQVDPYMAVVIVSRGLADGRPLWNGEYLRAYDPEGLDGMGSFEWTPNLTEALKLSDHPAAFGLWRSVPKSRPRRSDGKPNRPLTAFNIEILTIPDA